MWDRGRAWNRGCQRWVWHPHFTSGLSQRDGITARVSTGSSWLTHPRVSFRTTSSTPQPACTQPVQPASVQPFVHRHRNRSVGQRTLRSPGLNYYDRFQADLDAFFCPIPDVGFGEFIDEARLRVLLDQFLSQLLDGGGVLVGAQEIVPIGVQVVSPLTLFPGIGNVNLLAATVAFRQRLCNRATA